MSTQHPARWPFPTYRGEPFTPAAQPKPAPLPFVPAPV